MPNQENNNAVAIDADQMNAFLDNLRGLPGALVEGLINNASDQGERAVIESMSGVVTNQFGELASFIEEQMAKMPPQNATDVNIILRVTDASNLSASAMRLAPNISSSVSRLGFAGIVMEIKKIISILLEGIGIRLPDWLLPVFNLIDEIVNLLLSLGFPGLSGPLSRMEQDHLAELAQVARLRRETNHRFQGRNDEDS